MAFQYISSICFIATIFCATGCRNYSPEIEQTLQLAGDNRIELEKVLEHYAEDSLKLAAAEFLIENMPGHYSYADTTGIDRYYHSIDSLLSVMSKGDIQNIIEAIDSLGYAYSWIDQTTVEDIQIITAEFLIANIDSAFSKWESTPWGRHLSFEQFCETLLPYKAEELQPFDNWRAYLIEKFPINSPFRYCDQFADSPLRATAALHDEIKAQLSPILYDTAIKIPLSSISTKIKMPYGTCDDYKTIAASIMRAHGIPVYNDFTPLWGFRNRLGHSWNVLPNNNGREIPYVGGLDSPFDLHKPDERIAKAFRQTYARNQEIDEILQSEKYIPELFRNPFQKDVTPLYSVCSDITIDIKQIDANYIYLAIFSDATTWIPIDFAKKENDKAVFHNVGRGCAYLPIKFTNDGEMIPISDPISIDISGKASVLNGGDAKTTHDMVLYRKYPALEYVLEVATRIIGGEFQASDYKDFHEATTVHTIVDGSPITHEITLDSSIKPYRYWRYIQNRPHTFCNMSEIAFCERDSAIPTYGTIIGTDGYWASNSSMTKDKVFDGDILTAFDAPIEQGAWVGMDFGKPVAIQSIRYTGRGDGNSIEIGDTYELYYCDKGRWKSFGKQIATGAKLVFHGVPQNRLYLLRDRTKGQDERIFTYADGKQMWW